MSELLLYYRRPDPTTWVYMSSFLTIGVFFVFHRFWSIRNLDIALLILLAPGLLMVHEGRRREIRQLELVAAQEHAKEHAKATGDQQSYQGPAAATTLVTAAAQFGFVQVDPQEVADVSGNRGEQAAEPSGQVTDPISNDAAETSPADLQAATELGYSSETLQYYGFLMLIVVQGLILVRLLLDPMMVRRPLLNPNLTTGGLYFISISLFVFMMGNVVTSTPRMHLWQGPELGPGYALMHRLPSITTRPVSSAVAGEEPPSAKDLDPSQRMWTMIAKIVAILAHLAIVTGVVLIGSRHFGNLRSGVGCATLYLMLPYTAQMTGRVDHALPAALLLWAVLTYRRPLIAGVFFGLAAGLVYYPLFLLPLWISFYWQRGVRRFVIAVAATLLVLVVSLSLGGTDALIDHFRRMFGLFQPTMEPQGIWGLGWNPIWRLPVIVGFGILSALFAFWPSPKNLGTLISCTAALMVAAQFWHGYGGGLYIAWFLPLLLLAIFRPNLQDRVALKVVEGGAQRVRQPEPEVKTA